MRSLRMEHRQHFLAVFILFVITLGIFWPFVLGGQAIIEDFTLRHQYPILVFTETALRSGGDIPLWTQGYFSGFPYYLSAFWYIPPITTALVTLGWLPTFNLLLFLSFFIGSVFVYFLGINLRLSEKASLLAGAIYATSQINIEIAILPLTLVTLIVPIVFFCVERISREKYIWLPLGSAALFLSWISGFGEYTVYTCIFVILFALTLDIKERRLHALPATFGMIALSTLCALPRLIVIAEQVPNIARAKGTVGHPGFFNASELISYVFPYFDLPFAGSIPFYHRNAFSLYVGVTPLVLMAVFFRSLKSALRERTEFIFFTFLFLYGFLMLFEFTGIYWLTRSLTWNLFGGEWKLLFLSHFALALMAGYGLDLLPRLKGTTTLRRGISVYAWTLITTLVGIGAIKTLLFVYHENLRERILAHILRTPNSGKNPEHYRTLATELLNSLSYNFSPLNFHFIVSLLLFALPLVVLILFNREKITYARTSSLLIILTGFGNALLWQHQYASIPSRYVTEPPATAQYLHSVQDPTSPFRIFRFWPGRDWYSRAGLKDTEWITGTLLEKELLTPNMNVAHGIEVVDGDDNLTTARQSKISAEIGSFRASQNIDRQWISHSNITLPQKLERFSSAKNQTLLSMLNVKYVISSLAFPDTWTRVFETTIPGIEAPITIYENPNVLPRLYFAGSVLPIEAEESRAWDALLSVADFRKTTIIECVNEWCKNAPHVSARRSAEILEEKPGFLRARLSASKPGWLIYSISNIPTWDVRLLSKDKISNLPISTANYLYQAVYIPEGSHEITFTYQNFLAQPISALRGLTTRLFELSN